MRRSERPSRSRRLLVVAANPAVDRVIQIEALRPGSIHRPTNVLALAGGKSFNMARAAHLLGAHVTVVAMLGGHTGRWLMESAAREGLAVIPVETGQETRQCTSIMDASQALLTEIYETGNPVKRSDLAAVEQAVRRELRRGDVYGVACSGSIPPGASVDTYARILRIAGAFSVPVHLDASGPALSAALPFGPTVVKVNRSEAADATQMDIREDRDVVQAARSLLDRGAANVVITLGTDGAIAVPGAGRVIRVEPPDELGSFAVGSGDAFFAGLIEGWGRGPLSSALRLAAAAGMSNARIPGAGRIDPRAVRRHQRRIAVQIVETNAPGPG
jgi:1-phosphofructokinase family hexose kinase